LLQEGNKDQPGVIPCTLQWLFDEACFDKTMSYSFSLSMLEVYKGRLRDLLVCQQHSTQCTHPASKW
jgi:kinesin family protein C2/C3